MATGTGLMPLPGIEVGPGSSTVHQLPVKAIKPSPFQARSPAGHSAEAFEELLESIRVDGLRYPVRVRRALSKKGRPDGTYEMVCGHRRLAAFLKLGLNDIPAEICALDDAGTVREMLIENLMREDLTPLEEARQLQLALEKLGLKVDALAKLLRPRRSPSYVRERLKLLSLTERVQEALAIEAITAHQTRYVEMLTPLPEDQKQLLDQLKPGVAVSDAGLRAHVERAFRAKAIRLSDETPFDWKTECGKAGCLAKNPDGEPVCVDRAMYVRVVAETHRDELASALAAFVQKHRAKAWPDVDLLPVFYSLTELDPMRYAGTMDVKVEGMPVLPVSVTRDHYSSGEAMAWGAHLPLVADKDGCHACPAWKPKAKQGRAILVAPASRMMTGNAGPRVDLLCMVEICRRAKQKEGRTVQEQKVAEKKEKVEQQQDGLRAQADAARDKLAKNRVLLLAAVMLGRDGTKQEARLAHDYEAAVKRLEVQLPPFGGRQDAALVAMMALGEEVLLRIHAERLVAGFDNAFAWNGKWMPNRLAATLALFGCDEVEEKLRASVGES